MTALVAGLAEEPLEVRPGQGGSLVFLTGAVSVGVHAAVRRLVRVLAGVGVVRPGVLEPNQLVQPGHHLGQGLAQAAPEVQLHLLRRLLRGWS